MSEIIYTTCHECGWSFEATDFEQELCEKCRKEKNK